MKIAILSDLHVGPSAKAQDLCPIECAGDLSKYHEKVENYIQDFNDFLTYENITADYLFVPGDITQDAHPMEMKLASEFLSGVQKRLGIADDHLLFVPGNHDADWNMYDSTDKTGIKWENRYLALRSSKFIFDSINRRPNAKGDLLSAPFFFKVWEFDDLIVVGYNSASRDTKETKVHCGDIVRENLAELESVLKSLPQEGDSRVRIGLLHHHLRNFPLPKPSDRDYSIASNGEDFIELLRKYHFDFIVHGHRHHSYFAARAMPMPILAAGSFSAILDTSLAQLATNQFHIVEIVKDSSQEAVGVVRSWSNTVLGWSRSEENKLSRCLGYERPFGKTLSSKEMADKIVAVFDNVLRRNLPCFTWKGEILRECHEISYIVEAVNDIIDWCRQNICPRYHLDLKPGEGHDIIFIPQGGKV